MARVKKDSGEVLQEVSETRSERIERLRNSINKKAGETLVYDLGEKNPTVVDTWIPTGSRWLDSIICQGKMAGIPLKKITELAGEPSSAKSYMALQIGFNALKKDIDVVYFDSESAIDEHFLKKMGYCLDDFMYIQAKSCEFVLETIEDMMKTNNHPTLFIWDSLAQTPCESDIEGDFDPQSSVAVKARVLSKGFQKLTIPIANNNCGLLIVNQLKTKIGAGIYDPEPFTTPGGKTPTFSYSLRIWLTVSNSKKNRIDDRLGEQVGSHVKALIKKSRFGSLGRSCSFKILWRERDKEEGLSILDEDSWLEAIKKHPRVSNSGAWTTLTSEDGTQYKYQEGSWLEKLKDKKFREEVLKIMDELYIGS